MNTARTLRTSLLGLGATTLLALPTVALAQPNPDDWGSTDGSGSTSGETPVTTAAAPRQRRARARRRRGHLGYRHHLPDRR